MDVHEYERLFRNFQSDLERQIKAGQIYPSTVKRNRDKIETIIGYIQKSGADGTPFQTRLDDYISDAQRRVGAAKQSNRQSQISTKIPTIPPMRGIESIAPTKPTWCATFDRVLGDDKGNDSEIPIPVKPSQISLTSIQQAAKFSCGPTDFAPAQQWMAAYRQTLSNLLGLTSSQNEALLIFASSQFEKPKRLTYAEETALKNHPPTTGCDSFPNLESGLLEARVSRNLERHAVQCRVVGGDIDMGVNSLHQRFAEGRYPFWLIDIDGGTTTELAKLGLVLRLLRSHGIREEELYNPAKARNPSRIIENYALARMVERDPAKALAEIEALPISEPLRAELTLGVRGSERAFAIVDGFAREAAATNPALQAVFFDGPEAGRRAYQAEVGKSRSTLDLVLALEDRMGSEPGGMDGCGKQVQAELTDWLQPQLQSGTLTDPADLHFQDHRGSLLLFGAILCGYNDPFSPVMAETFKDAYYGRTSIQRGPLSAAYQGMMKAYGESQTTASAPSFSSRRGADAEPVKLEQIFWNPVAPPLFGLNVTKYYMRPEARGVIAAVQPTGGDRVTISFKSESHQSPIRDCVATNIIDYIDDNGNVIPRYNCRTTGYETVTVINEPVVMPAWVATSFSPGQLLVYRSTNTKQDVSLAWPVASYRTKAGKTLTSMLGVPVR